MFLPQIQGGRGGGLIPCSVGKGRGGGAINSTKESFFPLPSYTRFISLGRLYEDLFYKSGIGPQALKYTEKYGAENRNKNNNIF